MIRAMILAAALGLPTGAVGQENVASLIGAPCTETLDQMKQLGAQPFDAADDLIFAYLSGMMNAAMALAIYADKPADSLSVETMIASFRQNCLAMPTAPTAGVVTLVFGQIAEDILD